jgi:MFS family permease
VLRPALIGSGLCYIAAATVAQGPWSLLVILVAAGVANGLTQPGVNTLVTRTIPLHRQGVAFAVKQSAIPATALIGGVAVPLFGETVGWRWAYAAFALLPAAAIWLIGLFDTGPVPRRGEASQTAERAPVSVASLGWLAAGIGLGAGATSALGAFFVTTAVAYGLERGTSGWLAAAGALACVITRLVVGRWCDRSGRDPLSLTVAMLATGAVAFAAIGVHAVEVTVVATAFAFGLGWGWPGLFNLAVVRRNPHAPGVATGITQTGTYVGAMAGPLAIGWLADHVSITSAWITAAALLLAAAVCIAIGGAAGGRRAVDRARRPLTRESRESADPELSEEHQ